MATETQAKPMRLCIGCGQTDDHPRHVTNGQKPWHMDCHALTGCESCKRKLAVVGTDEAIDGVKGEALQALFIEKRDEIAAAAANAKEG